MKRDELIEQAERFLYSNNVTFGGIGMDLFVDVTKQMGTFALEHEKRVLAQVAAYVKSHRGHYSATNDCVDDILKHIAKLESPDTEVKNDD